MNFTGAISDFNTVIEFNPKHELAYYKRGQTKIALNDKKGAYSDWRKAGELGCTEAYDLIKQYNKK